MSDELKHECGVALVRLRKPISFYEEKYGTSFYGYRKLALLLEKQHNRGQDGAGIACVALHATPGHPYYRLEKSCSDLSLADLLAKIDQIIQQGRGEDAEFAPFSGEVYLGHLRYGTFGTRCLEACQPMVRPSAWRNHTLLLAGNFNLTNTPVLFQQLVAAGHHPASTRDTELLLAQIGHFIEKSVSQKNGSDEMDMCEILRQALKPCDGGFTLGGVFGNGDAFVVRDAAGIRPGFYYADDEVFVAASERAAIQTAFDLQTDEVKEVPPGQIVTLSRSGVLSVHPCLPQRPIRQCVFERIYFSRGNDADIHHERRALGAALMPQILEEVNHDLDHTVFSYIPNTAQIAFHGLLDSLYREARGKTVRFAQIAVKDTKFRTFISDAAVRKELAAHVYDVTHGVIVPGEDTLVVLDDSIVRGNTLRHAILRILDRLGPRKIVVVSSAPPICYPDCYGIDMARFGELVAFKALVSLLKKSGQESALDQAARKAAEDLARPDSEIQNEVQPLYARFMDKELTDEISRLLRPDELRAEVKVIYQSCAALRKCCPGHTGDWYFTGDYPTPGGTRTVNRALINFVQNRNERPYQ